MLTANHDPLRDEGEAYARRLVEEAGVPVTLWHAPGQLLGSCPWAGRCVLPGRRWTGL